MSVINPNTGRKIKVGGKTYNQVFGKSERKPSGRGSATRGWKEDAPKRGKEREELLSKCGDGCFLLPSELKFPICAACKMGKCDCTPDRRGVISARIRASQYGYSDVAARAKRMSRR